MTVPGGPSEAAKTRATSALLRSTAGARGTTEIILNTVHDPALGLDRSVRLGDVLDAMDEIAAGYELGPAIVAVAAELCERFAPDVEVVGDED